LTIFIDAGEDTLSDNIPNLKNAHNMQEIEEEINFIHFSVENRDKKIKIASVKI